MITETTEKQPAVEAPRGMKIEVFEDRYSWLEARRGKITGSRLGDVYSPKGVKKIGFYEVIAERLGISDDGSETPMDRGTRLEGEALDAYEKETGRKLDRSKVLWMREDNEAIAISPDASVIGEKRAVEAKCLSSARHIEAVITGKVPKDYEYQRLQYFIVNEELQQLDFVFYDPRLYAAPVKIITTTREEVQDQILAILAYQRDALTEIDAIVNQLSNF
jgi:predicted phage-related endonuclease